MKIVFSILILGNLSALGFLMTRPTAPENGETRIQKIERSSRDDRDVHLLIDTLDKRIFSLEHPKQVKAKK